MATSETQTVPPEPVMDVPSVNPEVQPVADSESETTNWVDPIFAERNDNPLPDEIVEAGDDEAEQAANAETERAEPTVEQLAKLVEQEPSEDDEIVVEAAPDETGGIRGKPEKPVEEAKEEPAKDDEDSGDAGSDTAADEDKPKKPRRRSQARRERREQARTIEAQGRAIAELKAQIQQPVEEVPEVAPTLEDSEFDEEKHATATKEWMEQRIEQGVAKGIQEKAAAVKNQAASEAFAEKQELSRDLHDDFDEVVYDDKIVIPTVAAETIWTAEFGTELAYYLATHQDEARAMAEMSHMDVARELVRIETHLTAEQAAPASEPEENTEAEAAEQAPADEPARQELPEPTPTKAPPVIRTLGGAGAAMRPNIENMSMDEYAAGRRSGKIR